MRRLILSFVFVVFAAHAVKFMSEAQAQQATPPDPVTQALYEKLSSEIQSNVQERAYIIQLQAQLKAAQDELAKLKAAKK